MASNSVSLTKDPMTIEEEIETADRLFHRLSGRNTSPVFEVDKQNPERLAQSQKAYKVEKPQSNARALLLPHVAARTALKTRVFEFRCIIYRQLTRPKPGTEHLRPTFMKLFFNLQKDTITSTHLLLRVSLYIKALKKAIAEAADLTEDDYKETLEVLAEIKAEVATLGS